MESNRDMDRPNFMSPTRTPIPNVASTSTASTQPANAYRTLEVPYFESICPICLEGPVDSCFANNCLHEFCFTCLYEWSKVNAKCPLCKLGFDAIIYNVRSNNNYDVYNVQPYQRQPYGGANYGETSRPFYRAPDAAEGRRGRMMANSIGPRPAAVPVPFSFYWLSNFYINHARYWQWVYSLPHVVGRCWNCSPQSLRLRGSEVERVVPWLLHRVVIYTDFDSSHVMDVMNNLIELLFEFPIGSREFRDKAGTILGSHADIVLSNIDSYATRPYDFGGVDQAAHYMHPAFVFPVMQPSVAVPPPEPNASQASPSVSSNQNEVLLQPRAGNVAMAQSPTPGTSGEAQGGFSDGDYSDSSASPASSRSSGSSGSWASSASSDSASDTETEDMANAKAEEIENDDSDECTIIDYVKPRHERTAEVITVDSDPEVAEEKEVTNDCVPTKKLVSDGMIISSSSCSSQNLSGIKRKKILQTRANCKRSRMAMLPPKKRPIYFSSSTSSSNEGEILYSWEDDRSLYHKRMAEASTTGYKEPVADSPRTGKARLKLLTSKKSDVFSSHSELPAASSSRNVEDNSSPPVSFNTDGNQNIDYFTEPSP